MSTPKCYTDMSFEEQRAKIAKLNVIDDVFFQKMVEDNIVCRDILRIILNEPELEVLENRPQYNIKNLKGHSVIFDLLCKLSNGKYCNVEMQKADNDNHQKRVRYNSSLLDTGILVNSTKYEELPDTIIIYISEFDMFGENFPIYHVKRVLAETGTEVYNGITEIYVNTAVNDGSIISELMNYFKNSNGECEVCPSLSNKVNSFKNDRKEVAFMCKMMQEERWNGRVEGRAEGRAEGKAEERLASIKMALKNGGSVELVKQLLQATDEEIAKAQE